ncbi:MAG: hypothetical protein A2051_01105 [Desulfovibrionales bacterium GWA2_65_9]|nr:MAG: hypothetical protein A2051_01105 [Desulfovibrionales bacterium GWA2_65_9]
MQKREKQLLGVMAVALMVGAYMYVSAPGKPAPAPVATGASKVVVDEVAKAMDQARLTPQQAYRLGLLADNATGNPFYGGSGGISLEEDRSLGGPGAEGPEFVYSGYMKLGKKLFAVLNGVEYAIGDELAEGGYRVQGIDRNFVILERTDGSTGRKLTRRVPLVEDDTDKIRIRVVKKR